MTDIDEQYRVCNKCKHLRSLEDYHKEKKADGTNYIRTTCKRCRNKQRRDKNKETGYWHKRYRSMSEEERAIYIKKKSEQNQLRFKTNPEALRKKKLYDKTDKGIYNRYRADCNRRGRKKRGIQMLLKFEEFSNLISQPCYYCDSLSRGIDRVDPNKDYTINNSVSCCKLCNQMKNDLPEQEFVSHIQKILTKQSS